MNPWIILGWGLIIGLAALVLALVVATLVGAIVVTVKRRQALKITPKAGQVWSQDGKRLYIKEIGMNGIIKIASGMSTWWDTTRDWKDRLSQRVLYLLEEAPQ